jgi:DNA (cytosine-5)-methyltransferase 1
MTENKNKTSRNKTWELVNFCEFDKFAIKSYCAVHNVDESLNLGDITKVDETQLKPFNVICGGSPCQDFSIAGKGKGSVWTCKQCGHAYNPLTVHWSERDKCPECGSRDIEKTRSSLLVEYLRVIRANKPNFGIYENVKNIVGKKFKDTTFKLFTQELEEYGYNVYWKVLNAKHYGIPQNRERVYLIFIKKELDNSKFKYPEPFDNGVRLRDILDDEVDEKFYLSQKQINKIKTSTFTQERTRIQNSECCQTLLSRDFKDPKCVQVGQLYGTNKEPNPQAGRVYDPNYISPTMDTCSGGNRMPKVAIKQATKKGYAECEVGGVADLSYPDSKTRRGRVQEDGKICPTLTATETGVCRIESDIKIRKLTPKECWRLMGFDDKSFEAAEQVNSNSQLYKQAGNSIVVDVLYYIFVELYKAMPYLFDDLKLSSFFSGIGAFEIALNRLYQGIQSGNFIKWEE